MVVLDCEIGVDIEIVGREADVLDIAKRSFSSSEVADIFRLSNVEDRINRFYDYWTLKESYIKATGLGLKIPLDQFCFQIGVQANALVNHDIKLSQLSPCTDRPERWRSWLIYPHERHRLSITIQNERNVEYHFRFFETIPMKYSREVLLPLET